MRSIHVPPVARISTVLLASLLVAAATSAQSSEGGQILLPNMTYSGSELPESPGGKWQMLKMNADETFSVVATEAVSTPVEDICIDEEGEATARDVRVPESAAVLLLRGIDGLTAGPKKTAFWKRIESSSRDEVELGWSAGVYHLRYIRVGDGRRLVLSGPSTSQTIYSNEWEDEGSWMLRWAGDLNDDGLLDLILDASHKYSISTTRLYLSNSAADGSLEQVATLTTTAC